MGIKLEKRSFYDRCSDIHQRNFKAKNLGITKPSEIAALKLEQADKDAVKIANLAIIVFAFSIMHLLEFLLAAFTGRYSLSQLINWVFGDEEDLDQIVDEEERKEKEDARRQRKWKVLIVGFTIRLLLVIGLLTMDYSGNIC